MSTEVRVIRENTEYKLTVPTGERQEITLRWSLVMRGFIIISDHADQVPPYTDLEAQINILGVPTIKRGRFKNRYGLGEHRDPFTRVKLIVSAPSDES